MIANGVGKPYIWGGNGPNGFDCSGIGYAGHKAVGNQPNHRFTTHSLRNRGSAVGRNQLQPGDAIITNGGGHMVWYIGAGNVMEFASRGTTGRVRKLSSTERIVAIRRISPPGATINADNAIISPAAFGDGTSEGGSMDLMKILEPLAAIAESVTDPMFWIRIGMFIGGVIMVLIGLGLVVGSQVWKQVGKVIG
jgi:hypothetical protein